MTSLKLAKGNLSHRLVKHGAALFFGMARTDPQMNLRLPVELKEQIEDAAAKNMRTLTAEVVARLQATFEPHSRALDWGADLDALAEKIAQKVVEKQTARREEE